MRYAFHALAPILSTIAAPIAAQQGAIDAAMTYDAAFYAAFAPATALDMVNQTPGFSLIEGSERRGLSGATGNVLVDGDHPIAKSQTLGDILQRIPAKQILRIELLRGARAASDGSGHAVLLNIVRTPSAGQGVWSLGAEYAGRVPMPNGWASWSGRVGRTEYSLGASGYSLMRNLPGHRTLSAGDGTPTGSRDDESPRTFYESAINGEAARPVLGGRLHLTGQFYLSRYGDDSSVTTYDITGRRVGDELNPYVERKRTFEGGIDYQHVLGRWDLTLAGLVTRTRFASDVSSTARDPEARLLSRFTQGLERHSSETILRATLAGSPATGLRTELGVEGAVNTLDQRLDLAVDTGAGPFPLPVPNSNLHVLERRAEAYFATAWTIGKRWSLEARLTAETSRLSFTGDTERSVDLAYLKPSLRLTRRLGSRDQLRFRVYRDVGQLDFTNFVSAASLADDLIKGGNPELRPEIAWRAEAGADFRYGRSGAVGLTVFHYWISDAVDLVTLGPPGARFDAPGNVGAGRLDGAQLTVKVPLGRVVPGGSITIDGTWRTVAVTDPLTGVGRTLSNFDDQAFKVEFRQDRTRDKLAWGIIFTGRPERIYYRFNEIERGRASPSLDLWAETTVIKGLKVKATLLSMLGAAQLRERVFYTPDRSGNVASIERTRRYPGRWLLLSVSGSL